MRKSCGKCKYSGEMKAGISKDFKPEHYGKVKCSLTGIIHKKNKEQRNCKDFWCSCECKK